MKKIIFTAIAALMLPVMSQAESVWSGGVDVEWNYDSQGNYMITTADELAGLAQRVNNGESFAGETFVLTDDINLADFKDWSPIGFCSGLDCGGTTDKENYFSGTFDGRGHTVSHIYIHYEQDFDDGFFGWSKAKEVRRTSGLFGAIKAAKITNLVVRDSYIFHSTGHYSNMGGAVVGFSTGNSIITNCVAINNTVEVVSLYKWIGVGMGRAYAGAICGASGEHNDTNGINTNSDASVSDCAAVGNTIHSNGNMKSSHDDIINGGTPSDNNVYSNEEEMAADSETIARKNEKAIYENVVNNANPPYYLWSNETGLMSDIAVFSLNTTPEIIGGGVLHVYAPNAVEYTFDGVTYQTVTNRDEIHVTGLEYAMPTTETNGYQMYYYKCYCSGVEFLHRDATGIVDFDDIITGITGNVTIQGVFSPSYLVNVETNGVSDAFVYGTSSYVARENELVSVTLYTDTIYIDANNYRYFTLKSLTLNGADVIDLVMPGNISVLEFAMPASSVNIYAEFEENVYTSVKGVRDNEVRLYGVNGALVAETTTPTTLTVAALDGRVVYHDTIEGDTQVQLPAGVYIANGRKVVVR